ncbi:Pentulose kinase [Punctularia strigosozonata HHB-11173 SS5]|uniref:Pentulose kinase n=1 Tax=Punctularia strigosozonata (strain HHB-11173) TaxID=741275 RepID=UPI00044179B6|nr:Pentulose kinase [Punctularia strigosozonata HHB-11173 SS5]EIN10230.1 Pentulose kinase [Punctularia strigosozonata HHB-11173 SS5]
MASAASESYYIGIDVGTGSARAGLVKADGTLLATSTHATQTWRDPDDHRIFEQSTLDIWAGIAKTVRAVLAESGVSPERVRGLGFDATCSLAVSDENGEPVTVTKGDALGTGGERNIILWADHRAEKEAELINSTGTVPLKYVGGTMSLEMEIPKVLWLKNHMRPDLFKRCQFFDLPDFLTYRATSDNARSYCSLTCKCSYVPSEAGWQSDFFDKIGLGEFVTEGFRQLGAVRKEHVLNAGMPVGKGLSKRAAEELGLLEGTPVGSGVIDAYAGWLGTVAASITENGQHKGQHPSVDESRHRLAAVAGTSTCYVVQSPQAVFVPGVWGPYKDVVFPGWWMNEGGQSSTGQLIDFMIKTHPAYNRLVELAEQKKTNIHAVLQSLLEELRDKDGLGSFTEITKDMHFYPDLHGNRSPIADPRMRGSLVGLALDSTLHDLARKFNLTLEAIALQTRHIVDSMNAAGHAIDAIYMSGGQAKNRALMQLLADCCGMPVVLPADGGTAVVLGSAMLGRFADEAKGKTFGPEEQSKRFWDIMVEMTPSGTIVRPAASPKEKKLLEAKYKIFREAIDIQYRWRAQIEEASK